MTAATRSATKNVIVELLLLALAQSKLKDTGLSALRGVLLSDARLAVLDGAVDLQAVWDLLEGQPGWDAAAALGPFCFVKQLEPRLQVKVKLPAAMASLPDAEVIKHAAGCRPKREEVDRAIAGDVPKPKRRWSLAMRPVAAAPVEEPALPRWKVGLGIGAAVVTLVSLVFLAQLIISELSGPSRPKPMDAAEVSTTIPLKQVERWGNEVHAVLGDPSWLKEPEAARREQLERAVNRLSAQDLNVLLITDEAHNPRASAQLFGKPPRVFVRFY